MRSERTSELLPSLVCLGLFSPPPPTPTTPLCLVQWHHVQVYCLLPPPFHIAFSLAHPYQAPSPTSSGSMPGLCGTTDPNTFSWSFVLRTAPTSVCSLRTTASCSGSSLPPWTGLASQILFLPSWCLKNLSRHFLSLFIVSLAAGMVMEWSCTTRLSSMPR